MKGSKEMQGSGFPTWNQVLMYFIDWFEDQEEATVIFFVEGDPEAFEIIKGRGKFVLGRVGYSDRIYIKKEAVAVMIPETSYFIGGISRTIKSAFSAEKVDGKWNVTTN